MAAKLSWTKLPVYIFMLMFSYLDDPVTETTSSETTTDTSTIDNAYDFEDIVKKAQQKVEGTSLI